MRPHQMSTLVKSRFGDIVLVAFLVTQAADGVFTYVGLVTIGNWVEANPLVATLVGVLGQGVGLACTKVFAGGLGVILHFSGVHYIVAALTALYLAVAIAPWAVILFF